MISLLITLLIVCIIFGIVYWIIGMIPLPPPFGNVVRVVLVLIFLLWVIYALTPLMGHPLLTR